MLTQLSRLYVNNYRCLVNFEFKPKQVQLLVGLNGSGKSSVFEAIEVLRRIAVLGERPESLLGGATKTRWQSVAEQRFEIDVAGNGGTYTYALIVDEIGAQKRPRIRSESLSYEGKPLFQFVEGEIRLFNDSQSSTPGVEFHSDWHRSSGLYLVTARHDNTKLTWFKTWLENLLPVQINPWAIQARSESEARLPERNLANLGAWYRHLAQESPKSAGAAIARIAEVIPQLEDLVATEAGLDVRVLQARFRGPDGKLYALPVDTLSEGQRVLIVLYVLICNLPQGCTLLLDEPENFIALAEIQPWLLDAKDKIEESGGQLIIASHHPEILNQLAEDAIILSRDDGGPTRTGLFPATHSGLSAAEIVARGWEGA